MIDLKDLEAVILQKIVERMELTDINTANFSYTSPIFASDIDNSDEGLDLDSIDALELIVLIYDEWHIKVEENDMPLLRTVKNIADFVRENYYEK